MNIISCTNCGVVLDADMLNFPSMHYAYLDDDCTEIDTSKAEWDGDRYVPFVDCPVCKEKVFEP